MADQNSRTRRALDELADLFLTGTTGNAVAPAPNTAGPTVRHPNDAPSPGNPLSGPTPIRLAPKLGKPVEVVPPKPRPSAFDGPPQLRLHRPDEDDLIAKDATKRVLRAAVAEAVHRQQNEAADQNDTATDEPAPPQPIRLAVEAVLLGNLPGLAGPWLTQYAQRIAQCDGPVVILHLSDEVIEAEYLQPTDRSRPAQRPELPDHRPETLPELLDLLVTQHHPSVSTVLLHFDAESEAVANMPQIDRWTLLCGGDDAAVVAGYQLLKNQVERLARQDAPLPHIGVMIMGSPPSAGQTAADKLVQTVSEFLETPLQVVGTQQQIQPVRLCQLGEFSADRTDWARLVRWLYEPHQPVMSEANAQIRDSAGEGQASAAELRDNDTREATDSSQMSFDDDFFHASPGFDGDEDKPLLDPDDSFDSVRRRQRRRPPQSSKRNIEVNPFVDQFYPSSSDQLPDPSAMMAQPPQPVAHPQSMPPRERSERSEELPALSTFLVAEQGPLAGGVALEARCPDHPHTEIVLDQQGGLHLLRRDETTDPPGRDDLQHVRTAIVDLLQARRWVLEHMELLKLTQRQCQFGQDVEPTLHLFTARADVATGLVYRLDGLLKLHLLRQVRVGDQGTWFSTPLT